jgi:hypothetical protein
MKEMLLASPTWQTWAGLGSIYYHANVINIEGTNNYINSELPMPFAVIWLAQFNAQFHSPGCFLWNQQIALLIQDEARTPAVHNDSFLEYTNRLGPVIEEISALVGTRPQDETLAVSTINMVGEPMRVPPLKQNEENDFWTSTWMWMPKA